MTADNENSVGGGLLNAAWTLGIITVTVDTWVLF